MPRLLAIGHVSWDRREGKDVLGGSVSYAARTAQRLDWGAGILTAAAADFEPARDLPEVAAFVRESSATTRFTNVYGGGVRSQVLSARAADIDLSPLADT